jgi:hypothetical protein
VELFFASADIVESRDVIGCPCDVSGTVLFSAVAAEVRSTTGVVFAVEPFFASADTVESCDVIGWSDDVTGRLPTGDVTGGSDDVTGRPPTGDVTGGVLDPWLPPSDSDEVEVS